MTPEALVKAQVDAYNAHDMDAFIATFHPDVEFIVWPDTVRVRGHAGFRLRYGELWQRAPALRADILQRIVTGRFVIDEEQLVNHPDGERPPLAVVYETQDGLIRRFHAITPDT